MARVRGRAGLKRRGWACSGQEGREGSFPFSFPLLLSSNDFEIVLNLSKNHSAQKDKCTSMYA
jgi:hypothetical protein